MRHFLVILLGAALSISIVGSADELTDAADAGRDFGGNLQGGLNAPTADGNSYTFGSGETINTEEIFPGAGDTDITDWKDSYGNDQSALTLGAQFHSTIGAGSGEITEAYKTLRNGANGERYDLDGDPVLNGIKEFVDAEAIQRGFSGCTTTSDVTVDEELTHVPDIHQCTRRSETIDYCEITHDLEVSPIFTYAGGVHEWIPCGPGCMDVTIGKQGNEYLKASHPCQAFKIHTAIRIDQPQAITSANLEYMEVDDYGVLHVNGVQVAEVDGGWPSGVLLEYDLDRDEWIQTHQELPKEHGAWVSTRCERGSKFTQEDLYDFTHLFTTATPGEIFEIDLYVATNKAGEGFGRLKILYDESLLVKKDEWHNVDECLPHLTTLQSAADAGQCTGGVECTQMPIVSGDQVYLQHGSIPERLIGPSPVPNIPKACLKVGFTGECSNPVIGAGTTDRCQELEDDTNCAHLSTECTEYNDEGKCIEEYREYDCGYASAIPSYTVSETLDCQGAPIRCFGDECASLANDANSEAFAEATALLQVADMASKDTQCDQIDGCTVFNGEPMKCNQSEMGEVSRWFDSETCCYDPDLSKRPGIIKSWMAMNLIDDAIMNMSADSVVRGSWNYLRESVTNAWGTVKNAWTSVAESISGQTTAATAEVTAQTTVTFAQNMMNTVANFIQDVFGEQVRNAIFSGTGANIEFSGQISGIANAFMTAYSVYVIVDLALDMALGCDEEDYQLQMQRSASACYRIPGGSPCNMKTEMGITKICLRSYQTWCCFSSPLSRIIMEQIRLQGIGTWGTTKNPNCDGVKIEDLVLVDWSLIDLSEWVQMLSEDGLARDPLTMSLESLTGDGSVLNLSGDGRDNAAERATNRMEGSNPSLDMNSVIDSAEDQLWGTTVPPALP